MVASELKKTKLYDTHVKLGGKMIEFANWSLPVYYEGLVQEHNAVRHDAGLFDVSHMGEIGVLGENAQEFVNYIATNDISKLKNNQIAYSFLCYENGGVVDDLLIYKYDEKHFLLVVNASNLDKDLEWLFSKKQQNKFIDIEINNLSDDISQIAIQGPKSQDILQKITSFDLSTLKFFFFQDGIMLDDAKCLISRTGYTGEDGFEIYIKNEYVSNIFNKLLEEGNPLGLKPAGLGARDTLRFEATLPLYGQEISPNITPLEAGLGAFVKLSKESDFIGKESLKIQKEAGLKRKLVGFEMLDRAIPRTGYEVFSQDTFEKIGFVTTGYMSPTLGKNIGLAIIDFEYSNLDTTINILIRNKNTKAKIINKHFYQRKY